MSSVRLNPNQQPFREMRWARLIPGEMPTFRAGKKPAQSTKLFAVESASNPRTSEVPRRAGLWARLAPGPLHGRRAQRWVTSTICDFGLVSLTWLLAHEVFREVRFYLPQAGGLANNLGARPSWLGIALLHAALITLVAHTEGLQLVGRRLQMRVLGKSVFLATAVLCVASELVGFSWLISVGISGMGMANFILLWSWRRWASRLSFHARGDEERNVLIIGHGHTGRHVASCIERNPSSGQKVCGFLDDELPLGDGVLGRVSELARISRKHFVDEIILAAPRDSSLTARVLREAERLRLDAEIVPDLFGFRPATDEIERIGDLPVICLHAERWPAAAMVLKRWIDVVGAFLALMVLSPALILIAAFIKMDSPGPILYCAQRAGKKSKLFRCYKFRTMVANADELKNALRESNEREGPIFKIARDPRITRVGRYLRRFSLDELPQLWNVVLGDMSLVGPRPHPVDDVAAYQVEDLGRLDVTPGLTGLWQVTARKDPSFQRGMELDREYIRRWSLGLDARIVFRTVRAVVQGSGE